MKKILLLIPFLFLSLHAEYIIFKNKSDESLPITDSVEYAKIYNLLTTYQWPSIIGVSEELPVKEILDITTKGKPFEEIFLRKKLKEISSEYDLTFIPTVLYELYIIIAKETNEIPILKTIFPTITMEVSPLLINPKETPQKINKAYSQVNKLKEIESAHQAINSALIKFFLSLDETEKDIRNIIKNKRDIIAHQLTVEFKNKTEKSYLEFSVVKKLIEFETDAHQRNEAILYRGGRSEKIYHIGFKEQIMPIEIYFIRPKTNEEPTFQALEVAYKNKKNILTMPWAQSIPLGSVSYGNSLFAGFIFDITACAFHYIFKYPVTRPAYALSLDKRQYVLGNINKLIFYSPYNTLVSFFAQGEFFHSRTISYVTKLADQENQLKKWRVSGINYNFRFSDGIELSSSSFIDKARMFVRVGNPIEKAYELSKFIQENAFIFKVPLQTSQNIQEWFNPIRATIEELHKNQSKVTEMLKGMFIIQQLLLKKRFQK